MSNKLRMGVIGIGNMGSTHAKNIHSNMIKNLELTAVCDISDAKKEWSEKNLKDVPFFKDYKEMIKSGLVDAILIATPHYDHPDITIYGFENGMHVLSEKPAGVYTKQVEAMNESAKKSDKVFGIMYNQRTNPVMAKIRDIIRKGELGEVKRFTWTVTDWYRTQKYYDSGTWRATWDGEGGGVLINQCPHNLDLWQWLIGVPKRIWAKCDYGKWHNIEVEDDVTAIAEYENGATATFITTTGDATGTNRIEIVGDKGKIVYEVGKKMEFTQLVVSEREFCMTSDSAFGKPESTTMTFDFKVQETSHNGILKNFTEAVLEGKELLAPGEEGINGLTISNAIHLSDWIGEWVNLPIDQDRYLELLTEKRKNSAVKEEKESEIVDLRGSH